MPPLHSGELFICIHDLDPGDGPQDDTTSLKLRGAGSTSLKLCGAGTTVLCFLFLGTVCHPCNGGDRGRTVSAVRAGIKQCDNMIFKTHSCLRRSDKGF